MVSVLASEAIRELSKAGWTLDIRVDTDYIECRHGKLVRFLPYTDSLCSLVSRDTYRHLMDLIRFRTQN